MSISALASTAPAMHASRTPEAAEGPGPDHDGDADDKSVPASQPPAVSQTAPSGMGSIVNTRA
jgi:hypothetical protein